ncbi:MAG: hypothetical protein ABI675_18295 [Chitinophagaceae bacterium]
MLDFFGDERPKLTFFLPVYLFFQPLPATMSRPAGSANLRSSRGGHVAKGCINEFFDTDLAVAINLFDGFKLQQQFSVFFREGFAFSSLSPLTR